MHDHRRIKRKSITNRSLSYVTGMLCPNFLRLGLCSITLSYCYGPGIIIVNYVEEPEVTRSRIGVVSNRSSTRFMSFFFYSYLLRTSDLRIFVLNQKKLLVSVKGSPSFDTSRIFR